MRALVIASVVLAAAPASAETSINMGMDLGVVMGHGPLAQRLDAFRTVGIDLTFVRNGWAVEAGFVLLDGEHPPATASLGASTSSSVEAAGAVLAVRRRFDRTPIGTSFIGAGFSLLELHTAGTQIGHGRQGVAYAPKLAAGLDLMGGAGGRHAGVSLAATYQLMIAALSDGKRLAGGYAGLELTMLFGAGPW